MYDSDVLPGSLFQQPLTGRIDLASGFLHFARAQAARADFHPFD